MQSSDRNSREITFSGPREAGPGALLAPCVQEIAQNCDQTTIYDGDLTFTATRNTVLWTGRLAVRRLDACPPHGWTPRRHISSSVCEITFSVSQAARAQSTLGALRGETSSTLQTRLASRPQFTAEDLNLRQLDPQLTATRPQLP